MWYGFIRSHAIRRNPSCPEPSAPARSNWRKLGSPPFARAKRELRVAGHATLSAHGVFHHQRAAGARRGGCSSCDCEVAADGDRILNPATCDSPTAIGTCIGRPLTRHVPRRSVSSVISQPRANRSSARAGSPGVSGGRKLHTCGGRKSDSRQHGVAAG
jgi:hypothetical protein